MHFTKEDESVVRAFTDCIIEFGVANLSVDHFARKLGWSRSSLYRQLGSWPQMIRFGYEAMLEWIDTQIPDRRADARVELETWWAALALLFRSPAGQAILATRTLAALHHGSTELDALETTRLLALKRWCAGSNAVFRATWSLIRAAASPNATDGQRLELREIVWLIVARGDSSPDLQFATALAPLM